MPVFRVVSSMQINRHFVELCERAASERRGLLALEIAQDIMTRLQNDPLSVGEELYQLKQMHLEVRVVVQNPWSIHFAVDQERGIVYLKDILLLNTYP